MERIGRLSINRGSPIGEGRFGTVFRGTYETFKDVAVKRFRKVKTQVDTEIYLKASVGHPNIIQYFCTTGRDVEFLYIAIELCSDSLEGLVRSGIHGSVFGDEREVLRQIIAGLDHLHSLGVVHGDLKPSNVLISYESGRMKPQMKLADFGLRHFVKEDGNETTLISGNEQNRRFRPAHTKGWFSPSDPEDEPVFDMFSLGCLITFTLCKGAHPFGETKEERVSRISQNLPILKSCEEKLLSFGTAVVSVISKLLDFYTQQRPKASELLSYRFFAKQLLRLQSAVTPTAPNNGEGQLVAITSSHLELPETERCQVSASFRPTESNRLFFPGVRDGLPTNSNDPPPASIPLEFNSPIPSTSSASSGPKEQQQKQPPMWPAYPNTVDVFKTPLRNEDNANYQPYYETPTFSLLSLSCSPTTQSFSNSMQLENFTRSPLTSPASGGLLPLSSTPHRLSLLPRSQVDTVNSNNASESETSAQPPSHPRPLSPIVVPSKVLTTQPINSSATSSSAAPKKRSRSKSVHEVGHCSTRESRAENRQKRGGEYEEQQKRGGSSLTNRRCKRSFADFSNPLNLSAAPEPSCSSQELTPRPIATPVRKAKASSAESQQEKPVEAIDDDVVFITQQRSEYTLEREEPPLSVQLNKLTEVERVKRRSALELSLDVAGPSFSRAIDDEESNAHLSLHLSPEPPSPSNEDFLINDQSHKEPELSNPVDENGSLRRSLRRRNKSEQGGTAVFDWTPNRRTRRNSTVSTTSHQSAGSSKKRARRESVPSAFPLEEEMMALCSRARLGQVGMERLRQLVRDRSINVNYYNEQLITPLLSLCQKHKAETLLDCVELFLERPDLDLSLRHGACEGTTGCFNALPMVCRHYKGSNLYDIVRLLLKGGINPAVTDINGDNALIVLCANYKHDSIVDVMELLLRRQRVDVHATNRYHWDALFVLCYNYKGSKLRDAIEMLIEDSANVQNKALDGWDCLMAFVTEQRNHPEFVEIVELLVENGVDVTSHDNIERFTALFLICANYKGDRLVELVRLLVENGADTSHASTAVKSFDWTALHFLARNEKQNQHFVTVVRLFVDNGFDLNEADGNGRTLFHFLCKERMGVNQLKIVRQLVVLGSLIPRYRFNLMAVDNEGNKPIDYLRKQKNIDQNVKTDLIKFIVDASKVA